MTDLPDGWEWSTLEDLAAAEPRAITDGPFGSNLKSSHYVDRGPRVIRLQNVGFGEFIDEMAHISSEHFESLRAHEVRAGDLVVASLGQDLPRNCLIPPQVGDAIVKADCIRVRLHPEINPKYVNLALQRPALRAGVSDQIHGVGRPRLGMSGIKSLRVPLPSRAEQGRIVAAIEEHLSRLDAANAGLHSATSRLRLAVQAIARALWQVDAVMRPLGEVAEIIAGPAFKSAEFVSEGEGIRLLRGDNIEPGRLRWRDAKAWPFEGVGGLDHLLVREGDVILAMDRPVVSAGLKLAVVQPQDLPALLVQRVARIRTTCSDPAYLYQVLQDPRFAAHLLHGQTGTQVPHVTLEAIRAFEIPLPDGDGQRRAASWSQGAIEAMTRLRSEIDSALARTANTRRSILAAAFAGKLVPQDPSDEPASMLLERIKAERAAASPTKRARKAKSA